LRGEKGGSALWGVETGCEKARIPEGERIKLNLLRKNSRILKKDRDEEKRGQG